MKQKSVSLKKKLTDHDHGKYITNPEFNILATDAFNARLVQPHLIAKTDFDAKLSSINRKLNANNSKHLHVENELKKLKLFDSSYFIGKSHFEENRTQNYLVFQTMYRYFKRIAGVGNGNFIYYWKPKESSDERINSVKTPSYSITPSLDYYGTKTRVEFNRTCLKQDKVIFNHRKVVNIYTVFEISKSNNISDYTALENCLFGAVTLTKDADIDRYKFSWYRIGFDGHGSFSFPGND